MLYLLLGTDEFSKKEYVEGLAKQKNAPVENLSGDFSLSDLPGLLAPSLFAAKKVFVVPGLASTLDEDLAAELKRSSQYVVLIEGKLDKRKTQTQKLLKDKEIVVKEFAPPKGIELERWVVAQAKVLGGSIEPEAAKELVVRIAGEETGGFGEKDTDLNQFHNELKKLLTYTQSRAITLDAVKNLVADTYESEAWDIVNAFADKNAKKAHNLMEKFFRTATASDEKGKIIQLNASLAEQFRNILAVKDFDANRFQDTTILEKTGWKSGRLFVVRKLAHKFDAKKVKDFCSKLAALDEQLKSSSTPPRVLLDLITAQIIF